MVEEPGKLLSVEVAYALPNEQRIIALEVPAGTTALDAAQRSGISEHFQELSIDESTRLGLFGHVVAPGQVLAAGDRVEIYRPLIADPKEVRKERAARAKARRAGAAAAQQEPAPDGEGAEKPETD
jgi:putative ubiquitin-RnfH superfamily antitoxin RatB of RatAB toxin-antitoxin module